MSRAMKRKHVFREVLEDDLSPPTEKQTIVKILSSKGNNLHEVLTPDQSIFLVSMPTKYRRTIWVKRGNYVLIEPIEEGKKVRGEIVKILSKEHIKQFKKDNVWPSEFNDDKEVSKSDERNDDEEVPKSDEKNDDDLFVNTNRVYTSHSDDEDDSSSSEADSDTESSDNSDS